MWEYMELPLNCGDFELGESAIKQCAAEKMREYDGTVFLCCSPRDKERMDTFTLAAHIAERQVKGAQGSLTEIKPMALAKSAGKKALFVSHPMQEFLGQYLSARPAGERHLLLYSRRFGNGPSPRMSAFMDFWMEQGVDILDLRNIDEAAKARDNSSPRASDAPR